MAKPTNTTAQLDIHQTLHNERVSVLMFGAGGGVDDTAAFQAAIDASHRVYVPDHPTGGHYIIKGQLSVTNTAGLMMFGDHQLGSGPRIKCNSFPNTTTDLFILPSSGFPLLQLENLFFDHDTGNAPRDFYRQTVANNQNVLWRNLYVTNMGGLGYNCPAGLTAVSPRFENCHFVTNAGGGLYMDSGNAVVIQNCRFTNAAAAFDCSIQGGNGITILNPVFDGMDPVGAMDRLRLKGSGLTVINPYVEWGSATSTSVLRDISVGSGATTAFTLIGGAGGTVTPSGGGGYSHTVLTLAGVSGATVLGTPFSSMKGPGTFELVATTCNGIYVNAGLTGQSTVSLDTQSATSSTLLASGAPLRTGQAITAGTLSGTTVDCKGASWAVISNGGATNMNQITGGFTGHQLTLRAANANTTLIDGGIGTDFLVLRGRVNHAMAAEETITFIYTGTYWNEIGR